LYIITRGKTQRIKLKIIGWFIGFQFLIRVGPFEGIKNPGEYLKNNSCET
jgi:hypothetical protein